jgi:hypothetical protein
LQWYLFNKERLKVEIELMERNGVNFQLCQDGYGNLLWRGQLFVQNHLHKDVRLVYPENFPYTQIKIYILDPKLPKTSIHVHEDGSICVMKPEEWSPDWTAYAMYLKAIEFLNAFYRGELDSPPQFSTYSRESFLERLLEALGP